MIPKLAIEKAIEAGWMPILPSNDFGLHQHMIALDRTFWQALGKSLGWGNKHVTLTTRARNTAHAFYDLILNNKPTDTFWQELLSDSQ